MALFSIGVDPVFLTRAAYAASVTRTSVGSKTLVCLFQRGAVDGLNMVVPHGDPHYYRARPRIAVPRPGQSGGALDLDGHFGLHPALEALAPYYHDGSLGIVHAVGSPASTRSHFDAQDYMETGTPGDKNTRTGWLNRHLQHSAEHSDTPFRGVAIGQSLPRALRGSATALAINDLQAFGVGGRRSPDRLTRAFEDLYQASATGLVATSSEEAFEAIRMLKTVDPARAEPANSAE